MARITPFTWSSTFSADQIGPSLQSSVSGSGAFPKCLQHEYLSSAIDEYHSDNQSVLFNLILGACVLNFGRIIHNRGRSTDAAEILQQLVPPHSLHSHCLQRLGLTPVDRFQGVPWLIWRNQCQSGRLVRRLQWGRCLQPPSVDRIGYGWSDVQCPHDGLHRF